MHVFHGMQFLKTAYHEGVRFNSRSSLSTYLFEFNVVFLLNLRKYGIGSLRKTSTESDPPAGPGPTGGELALILQQQHQQSARSHHSKTPNKHETFKSDHFYKI